VSSPSSRPLVLVADDYPENRRLFSLYLRKDYEVVEAASAEAALERIRDRPLAAALLDLNYQGGMTGFDLIRALRADPALRALPTIALTAHASPEDRTRCLAAGFDAYLPKPVFRAQMLTALAALLEQPERGVSARAA
jgi:CheY-like chemotaxis protein